MEHSPHKYKLNESLEKLVGFPIATRLEIQSALWEYIKVNQLLDKEKKKYINCDSLLREIFNTDRLQINYVILALKDVLQPVPKICFTLVPNITNPDIAQNEKVLDIVVDLEPPITLDTMPFFVQKLVLDEKDKQKEGEVHHFQNLNDNVRKIEKKMINIIEQTKNHLVKRNNYDAFDKNPELFIENFIMLQNKLLKVNFLY